jgi:hypothetical protein
MPSAEPTDTFIERRKKRSSDPLVALHLQLDQIRRRGTHEAVIVSEAAGVLVAGAGPWSTCEELAAYAPLWASDGTGTSADGAGASVTGDGMSPNTPVVRPLEVDGQALYVCIAGGAGQDESLSDAALGAARILRQRS